MSKLFSIYLKEKKENPNNLLLFKSGIFYIALDKDSIFLSSYLGLKLTNFNDKIKKCGFPVSSAEKYFNLIAPLSKFKIIDTSNYESYQISDYYMKEKTLCLLSEIAKIDSDALPILDAYKLLDKIKKEAINILNLENEV